ncbi:MAG: DeoR/GlpR transcriptional regulator [Thiotrichaceae bacterium]|nr:DeoR/GlpR transcriptional regulator [Thiotrichaceae bacterium]
MKPGARQLLILEILHQQGEVNVKDLVSQFGISAETIRRDLSSLSLAGKIHKTHGGGILPQIIGEGPYQQRMRDNVSAKRQIAKAACELIKPGEILFIDSGSTTLTFAEELSVIDNLTIITNSVDIAKVTGAANSAQVFLIGGQYSADNRETVGPIAISQLNQFSVSTTVLTVGGIHAEAGLTDYNVDEAHIAKAMIKKTNKLIILADSTKMDQIAPFAVTNLEKVDYLVSNSTVSSVLNEALKSANVGLITVS